LNIAVPHETSRQPNPARPVLDEALRRRLHAASPGSVVLAFGRTWLGVVALYFLASWIGGLVGMAAAFVLAAAVQTRMATGPGRPRPALALEDGAYVVRRG